MWIRPKVSFCSTNAQSAEELIENILFSIVPDNLIVAAMTPNILSVLSFSVVFGKSLEIFLPPAKFLLVGGGRQIHQKNYQRRFFHSNQTISYH